MQALQYLLIGSGIFFLVTFMWLLDTLAIFDCMKSNTVKSAYYCLNLIFSQSDQILKKIAKSVSRPRQTNPRETNLREAQASPSQLIPYNGV